MEVEKLKKKILDLAIQGKLVPQDPNDEPASVLVEKIREEKQRLIREGKIKAPKEESYIYRGSDNCYYEKIGNNVNCINDYIPFEIPPMWSFVRMETVMDVRDGTHDTPEYCENGIPFVTTKCLIDGNIDFSLCKYISQKDADEYNKRSYVDNKDILLAMIGTIGKPIIVNKDREFVIKNVALLKNIDIDLLDVNWIKIVLEAYTEKMKYEAAGGLQPFVSLSFLRKMIIPIPPQYQIKRIVNYLDSFDKLSSIISSNKDELNILIAKTKQRILEQIFDENSSYKSYYKNKYKLGEILLYEQPGPYIVSSTNYSDAYSTPVLTPGKSFILGYTDDTDGVYRTDGNKVIIFDDFTTESRLIDFDFKVKSSAMKILHISSNDLFSPDYMYYLLQTINVDNENHKRYWISEYSNLEIKVHDYKTQIQIVKDIDHYFQLLESLSI